jgi:hypothetical protein
LASILLNIPCPQCGRVAVEDYYYSIDVKYIFCQCCGYFYSSKIIFNGSVGEYLEEKEYKGYGIYYLVKKNGNGTFSFLNSPITQQQLDKYKLEFEGEDADKAKSCLVLYNDGEFTILFGNVPENFHLYFDEYKEKYDYDPFREDEENYFEIYDEFPDDL